MALSNDLIVSKGLSHRGRVGLERSGSSVVLTLAYDWHSKKRHGVPTNGIAFGVLVLDAAERLDGDGLLKSANCMLVNLCLDDGDGGSSCSHDDSGWE